MIVLLCISVILSGCLAQDFIQPEQVHLSLGDSPSEMVATWVTNSPTNNVSVVEYGTSQFYFTNAAKGNNYDVYQDGGSEKRKIYMHRVKMTGLKPGQKYYYHVGGSLGWSPVFNFNAMKEGSNWSPRFALYGDMGNKNAKSMARLQEETQQGHFDAIIHVGDFAYDMDTDNARYGDEFMKQIESIAAYLPYMTCTGNHENAYNFSNYKRRFTMPGGDGEGLFYSFDIGPVHFIAFDSEAYYYVQYGFIQLVNQFKWLQQDLIKANTPENRAKRPWIITFGHRPMYCSNNDDPEHCTNKDNTIREGIPYIKAFGLEDLFYKYGVDMVFGAHEHSYERMWPVYKSRVCNGSYEAPYTNPTGPVHIITGSAGCQEGEDPFETIPWPYSAARSDDYGYTRMTVYNSTHLYLEQVSDDQGGKVIDKMTYIKSKHGAGLYTC